MKDDKDFDIWNVRKKRIHSSSKPMFCNTREVWWVYLGLNVGFEQDGKNGDFVRPALVLKKFNNQIFLGIPLSTKLKPGNKFYVHFAHRGQEVAAVISQIKLFDVRRLKRKMYRLASDEFATIQKAFTTMILEPEK